VLTKTHSEFGFNDHKHKQTQATVIHHLILLNGLLFRGEVVVAFRLELLQQRFIFFFFLIGTRKGASFCSTTNTIAISSLIIEFHRCMVYFFCRTLYFVPNSLATCGFWHRGIRFIVCGCCFLAGSRLFLVFSKRCKLICCSLNDIFQYIHNLEVCSILACIPLHNSSIPSPVTADILQQDTTR